MNEKENDEGYHDRLKRLMDDYAHHCYQLTRSFPDEERYGLSSQLRRSAISVVLNFVEGYARGSERNLVYKNFLEISYGSLKESKYLVTFAPCSVFRVLCFMFYGRPVDRTGFF